MQRSRQPAARQLHVRREPVDAGEPDEPPGDGALAEEDDRRRAGQADPVELARAPRGRARATPDRRRPATPNHTARTEREAAGIRSTA